jgi:hypothetical protein
METPPPSPENPHPQNRKRWFGPLWTPLWFLPSLLEGLQFTIPRSWDTRIQVFFFQGILYLTPFYLYGISVLFLKQGAKPQQAYATAVLYTTVLIVLNAILGSAIFFAGCLCEVHNHGF